MLGLTNECNFNQRSIKIAIKAVRKRVTREESEKRYNLAHALQEEDDENKEEVEMQRIKDLHALGRHEYFFGTYLIWDQLEHGNGDDLTCYCCLRRYNDGEKVMRLECSVHHQIHVDCLYEQFGAAIDFCGVCRVQINTRV